MLSEIFNRKTYLPALIGAGACLLLLRTGFFSFFFLVPLGFVAYRYDYRISWAASILSILLNLIMTFGMNQGLPIAVIAWNILYFTFMALIFAWITSPPPSVFFTTPQVSPSTRLMAGSCLASLLFIGIFSRVAASPAFTEYLTYLIDTLASISRPGGADVVQNARFEDLTAEMALGAINFVMLRGGSLVSCALMFIVSRQLSYILAGMFSGIFTSAGTSSMGTCSLQVRALAFFHVHPTIIWVFSSSLLLVVVTRAAKLEIPEIILWNIIILCAILYLGQGLGILLFFLTRPSTSPFMRLSLSILFGILLFSPVLNVIFLTGFVLLGIAENWVPFRAPKQNGPPSTPEAGGD